MTKDAHAYSPANLELFREKITAARRYAGRLQSELADAIGINTQVLSRKLHGARQTFPTHTEVKQIVKTLADWDAISTQREANDLLGLMGLKIESFSQQEWSSAPLNKLEVMPQSPPANNSVVDVHHVTSSSSRPGSPFPTPATSLIGRESHIQALLERLRQPSVRLLTLLGIGGVGKTRLALEVARVIQSDFADGVFFVSLATVHDVTLALSTIVQELHIAEPLVETNPDRRNVLSYEDVLKDFLHGKDLLLVLDNVEQIPEIASFISVLLRDVAGLKIMVTSRTTLHAYGEYEFDVPPLEFATHERAAHVDDLLQFPALRLFVERAQAVYPAFRITEHNAATCVQICARLDGLPLAIELAAARTKVLSLPMILQRLSSGTGQSLSFLRTTAHNVLQRYQTLQKTLDWSYDLLDPSQRCFFRRLSVFLGGWTLDAAAMLGTAGSQETNLDDALFQMESLMDHSLVKRAGQKENEQQGENQEPRFYFLETIREYGLGQLAANGELEHVQRQHATYYLTLARGIEPELASREQSRAVALLMYEQDNLRSALTWAIEQHEVEIAYRLCGALGLFWEAQVQFLEAHRWIDAVLNMQQAPSPAARAKLLVAASRLALWEISYERARELAQEALRLYEQLNDDEGKTRALFQIGDTWHMQGEYGLATGYLKECLPRLYEHKNWRTYAFTLSRLGAMAILQGSFSQAWEWLNEALPLLRIYSEPGLLNITLIYLGLLSFTRGEVAQSVAYLREGLLLAQQTGNRYMLATDLITFGCLLGMLCGPSYAARVCSAAEALLIKLNTSLPAAYRPMYDAFLGNTRAMANEEMWKQWWNEGRELSEDELCTLVLAASEEGKL